MTKDLIKGFKSFKNHEYGDASDNLMQHLVEDGQSPKYFIISCIDSRTDPGTIFHTRPGSFFAHKAMGAIVRPYKQGTALAAALQFAVEYNNVEQIIVLGHTKCGAVKALIDGLDDPEISSFINVAKNALTKVKSCCDESDDITERTEQEVVLESAENLKTYPSIAKALEENSVKISPWIFDMETGDILEYDKASKEFKIITTNTTKIEDRKHHA